MRYEDLNLLSNYSRIVIAGSQRCGTTIACKMISRLLGYTGYTEEHFNVDELVFFEQVMENENIVVQAPGMNAYLHYMDGIADDVCVVYMLRDTKDVIASQNRIGWTGPYKPVELKKLERMIELEGWDYQIDSKKPIVETKLELFKRFQEPAISDVWFLDYEELKKDPDYIAKDKRANFHPRQVE